LPKIPGTTIMKTADSISKILKVISIIKSLSPFSNGIIAAGIIALNRNNKLDIAF
jgi:biotin synthase-like enzyme